MEVIKFGMLGLGTVGTGVVKLLEENPQSYENKLGCKLSLLKVAEKNLEKGRKVQLPEGALLVGDSWEVVNDPNIQIIIELIGGGIGGEYDLSALNSGKHLVTADKDLIATRGEELAKVAVEKGVDLVFNAAVGGGIRPIPWLAGLTIEELIAIANATTNYILTLMGNKEWPFEQALAEAIKLGYAETDPSSDIEGRDAAFKLAILAGLIFNRKVSFKDVYPVEGISSLEPADFRQADRLGYTIKLIALAREVEGQLDLRVHPMMVPKEHPLANTWGRDNAFCVVGKDIGRQMIGPGPGAGCPPTAHTVITDLLEVCEDVIRGQARHCPAGFLNRQPLEKYPVGLTQYSYYLRLILVDRPGSLGKVNTLLGDCDVSIAQVEQQRAKGGEAEVIIVTHLTLQEKMDQAFRLIQNHPAVKKACKPMRILASLSEELKGGTNGE